MNAELMGGRNPLHYAADYGQSSVIDFLVTKGADVNVSQCAYNDNTSLARP